MFGKKEYSPERLYQIKRKTLIADIVLIGIILGIAIYVVIEIESVKFLSHDPCKVCMEKTGANCFTGVYNPNSNDRNYPILPIINQTENSSDG